MTVPDPKDIPTKLTLALDSEDAFQVTLTDDRNLREDLSVFDDAKISIKESLGGAALITRQVTGPANLAINTTDDVLDADALTVGELATLAPGFYVADVLLHHTVQNAWHRADRFYVDVQEGVTDVP